MPIITLTTDFGIADWFVGTMKGVIAGLAPKATVVDLTHGIPAGDIRAGAFALAASCAFFPKNSIHVAVVDPGVGSARQAIAVRTAKYYFVGPDNGLLSWALAKEKVRSIHALENQSCFLEPVSHTFHGRDLFAPVAAHLARGLAPRNLGRPLQGLIRLPWPQLHHANDGLAGEVIYLDRFGNAITNIDSTAVGSLGKEPLTAWQGRKRLCDLATCYQSVRVGRPVAVLGSTGFLEIAVHGGNAARNLRLHCGSPVQVHR